MNKGILILIAIVILIGGGIGVMVMNRPAPRQDIPTTDTTSTNTNAIVESGSLRSLMTMTGSNTCTFTDTTTGNSGTIYTNNGSMKGDFLTMMDGTSTPSHMIAANNTLYVWMDNSPNGFTFSMDQLEKFKTSSNAPKTVDIDQQIQYECRPWTADTSVFTVPTTIEFTDMTAMMESVPTMMDQGTNTTPSTSQCAACDSLSGDYKAQCLQALNCN